MSTAEVKTLISKYIDHTLNEHERDTAEKSYGDLESITELLEIRESVHSDIQDALITNNQAQAEAHLQSFLAETGEHTSIAKGTSEYPLLLKEILKADVEISSEIIRRTQGDYSSDFNKSYEAISAKEVSRSPLASELINDFLSDRDKQKGNNPKTAEANRAKVNLFIEIVGDKPVTEYVRKDIKDYRDTLQLIPSNMKKKKAYRDLTIEQVIAKGVPDEERMSIQTVNDNLMRTTAFFKWLQTEQYRSDSIAENIKIANKANPKDARSPFSSEDLSKVFNHSTFTDDLNVTLQERPERVFVPLLGLYQGMRLNEACQLFEDDIVFQDNIPCIQIPLEDDKKGQKVKTKAGARVIPIHPKLLEAGFLDYVQQRRQEAPQQLLWKTLTLTRDGYAKNISTWFNKTLLVNVGLKGIEGRKLDFHSFRHSVLDLYNNSNKEQRHYQAIVGHSDKSVTVDTYGSSLKASVMLETMEVIKYSDVPEVNALLERLRSYYSL